MEAGDGGRCEGRHLVQGRLGRELLLATPPASLWSPPAGPWVSPWRAPAPPAATAGGGWRGILRPEVSVATGMLQQGAVLSAGELGGASGGVAAAAVGRAQCPCWWPACSQQGPMQLRAHV